jgi:hypothetical protein
MRSPAKKKAAVCTVKQSRGEGQGNRTPGKAGEEGRRVKKAPIKKRILIPKRWECIKQMKKS